MVTKSPMSLLRQTSSLIRITILSFMAVSGVSTCGFAQAWNSVGPYGGDARSFAYSPSAPSHILLGTTSSWIYETDNAQQWTRLSKISASDSLVVDNIVFDTSNPRRILVGAWKLDQPTGGVFVSDDEGHHWKPVPDMANQSVRALAQAQSDPKVWVAGTLAGIYRSQDGGVHWSLISPMGSAEIHEVESIAIDPVHPEIIYAGTWHLPWKTVDGGRTWQSIKQGLIVDSDVFSIIIDPKAPDTVYTSACSGIYKSTNAGADFHKIQGIPTTARRTRVLMQDPNNSNIVYAGTTEGLYRTVDAGSTWKLMTPDDIIINDIYVDPKNSQHVLMATDRSGVLESGDGSVSFHDFNQGFSERQVSSMVVDPSNPNTIYVGVLNDKRFGGVFVSKDAGETWAQIDTGLENDDVYALAMSPEGDLLAGTNRGIFRWNAGKWDNVGHRLKAVTRKVTHVHGRRRSVSTETAYVPDGEIEDSVYGIAFAAGEWYAATANGVYHSEDGGFVWRPSPSSSTYNPMPFWDIAAHDNTVLVSGTSALYLSLDQAGSWHSIPLPAGWRRIRYVAIDGTGRLWLGGRQGVAYSEDHGQTWQSSKVPINDISGLEYDPRNQRIMATSYDSDLIFGLDSTAKNWIWWNTGWRTHVVDSSGGHLVAATLLHGVLVQPEKQIAARGF